MIPMRETHCQACTTNERHLVQTDDRDAGDRTLLVERQPRWLGYTKLHRRI